MKFNHIGIFVKDLAFGRAHISALLPIQSYSDVIDDHALGVSVQFCEDACGVRYELVAPLGEQNPVTSMLKSGNNILNHVAYEVPNFNKAIEEYREKGAVPISQPCAAKAFNGKKVIFFLTPLKFIIELIER